MIMIEKILLLRYSDFHGVDTIAAHQKVIAETGHCWWAKIGKQPRELYLKEFLEQEKKFVLLYTAGWLYKSELGCVLRQRPQSNYPDYYERDIFGQEDEPSVFFDLLSIQKLPLSFLDDYVICSSGKEVMHDLKKTISSFMFIQDKSLPLPPKPEPRKRKLKKTILNQNSCVFMKNGKCANRSCINYEYDCLRPRYCVKQRPIQEVIEYKEKVAKKL